MQKDALFYIKWNVEDGEIILDQIRKSVSSKEILVVPYKITTRQAVRLKDRITDRFLYKNRKPFVSEIEYEFNKLFHVCKNCGHVTDKDDVNKAWGNLCKKCFKEYQRGKLKEYQANKDYRKKVRRFKEYLKTPQGKVDAVPISGIESNIRMEVIKQGKTMRDVSNHLNISDSKMSLLFSGKKLDAGVLQAICEYLMVPMERMLRMPRGVRIKRKDGVPAHWFDEGFWIKSE